MKRKRTASDDSTPGNSQNSKAVSSVSYLDGHYHGNFRNYYFFNPIIERMKLITADFFSWALSKPSSEATKTLEGPKLLDVGCNSGDLSIGLLEACKAAGYSSSSILGIDMDNKLVENACKKAANRKDINFLCYDIADNKAQLPGIFDISCVCTTTRILCPS